MYPPLLLYWRAPHTTCGEPAIYLKLPGTNLISPTNDVESPRTTAQAHGQLATERRRFVFSTSRNYSLVSSLSKVSASRCR